MMLCGVSPDFPGSRFHHGGNWRPSRDARLGPRVVGGQAVTAPSERCEKCGIRNLELLNDGDDFLVCPLCGPQPKPKFVSLIPRVWGKA